MWQNFSSGLDDLASPGMCQARSTSSSTFLVAEPAWMDISAD